MDAMQEEGKTDKPTRVFSSPLNVPFRIGTHRAYNNRLSVVIMAGRLVCF
jgi:hypothetical protein